MKLTKNAIKNLRAGIAFLRAEPRRADMKSGIMKIDQLDFPTYLKIPPCGTVCCLAGAMVIAAMPEMIKRSRSWLLEVEPLAEKLLDVRGPVAYHEMVTLFHLHLWPDEFKKRYCAAATPAERVEVMADRAEAWIAEHSR